MIIIGIDPGTVITGYGIVQVAPEHHTYHVIDYGCIRPPPSLKLTDRYLIIFEGIESLVQKYLPDTLVVETQFVNKNPQSAIKLGMARGVAIIAAKRQGMAVFEYSPTHAKRAITGSGRASKGQMQWMVQQLLGLSQKPEPADVADALALALCHAHTRRFKQSFGEEI